MQFRTIDFVLHVRAHKNFENKFSLSSEAFQIALDTDRASSLDKKFNLQIAMSDTASNDRNDFDTSATLNTH